MVVRTLHALAVPLLIMAIAWAVGFGLLCAINPDAPRQSIWASAN